MRVADAVIKILEKEKITTIFGYPGGAILPIYDALRNSSIQHILVRNEQSSVHAASGYARASHTVGVCFATSGPGATNLITGLATAYMDSIPLIAITGQVNRNLIGKDAFQEADIVGASEPFTKHNYLVKNPEDIPRILAEAFYIARSGRPGPVLIDIPRDVQLEKIDFSYSETVTIKGYKPTSEGHCGQIKKIMQRLKSSKRPLIYVGGGILRANAKSELYDFATLCQIPVIHTLMGIGSFPMDSPLYSGMVGFHGNTFTPSIIEASDLIMVIGTRLSDRATKNFTLLNPNTDVIHIDIDPAEIGKVFEHQIPIVGDAKNILTDLIGKAVPLNTADWLKHIEGLKIEKDVPFFSHPNYVNPKTALSLLSSKLNDNAIITADVGQNQLWVARGIQYSGNRAYLTSGGLGTMGYSLPSAIGAKLARPDRQVVATMGDGSFQMVLGELGTLSETKLPVIILLFNNKRLGMVRELQDNSIGKKGRYGIDFNADPDYVKIADAYGLNGLRISSDQDLDNAFEFALESTTSTLIELMVHPECDTI
jgi:acetolactate synthase-1/2/3 large subunit